MAGPRDELGTLSGSRTGFFIGGVAVGYAAGVSGGEQVNFEEIEVLDLLETREFVPVAYKCSLSAQIFRLIGKSLKALSIFPATPGGDKDDLAILTSGDLEATLVDKVSGLTYGKFIGVKCSGHDFDVSSRGVVSDNVSFVCIRLKDEFEGNP